MENKIKADWAEFSVARLSEFCRLQQYSDCYSDRMTRRFLQRAIFSTYLDCVQSGVSEQAQRVLSEWRLDARPASPAGARTP